MDECSLCSGIWFDFNELEKIMEKDFQESLINKLNNNAGHDKLETPCPRCGGIGKMISVSEPAKSFHIDTCTVCYGHWLDGGEYEKLKKGAVLDVFKVVF